MKRVFKTYEFLSGSFKAEAVCLVLIIVSIFYGSCNSSKVPDVMVVDEAGKPVSGAMVEPVSASMNYPKVMTDLNGQAWIGDKIQSVKWIKISKAGYEDVQVDCGMVRPIKVTLEKEHVRINFGEQE